jgi:hypothetical protein
MSRISSEIPLAFGYLPQYYLGFVLDVFRPLFFASFPRFDMSAPGTPRKVRAEKQEKYVLYVFFFY